MTKAEFIKAKLTAHTPQFKHKIGLVPVFDKTETLAAFVKFMHPKAELNVSEQSATVYADYHTYYTIYHGRIIKNSQKSNKQTMYII